MTEKNDSSPQLESSQLLKKDLYVSNFGTFMHLVKGNIGVGMLSLPWAIKHAGIVLGPVLLALIAITSCSCMLSLVRSSRHFCSKLGIESLNYGDVAFHSFLFGPIKFLQRHPAKARRCVNFFLMLTQLGTCCMYIVFIAQNIRQVVAVHWHSAPQDRVFMTMLWLPLTFLTFIRDLSKLAWFSGVANVILVTALCMIFRYLFTHLVPISSRTYAAGIADLPIFLGTACFTIEGIGIVLPVENAMKNPKDFPKVFYIAMTLVIILFTMIGFIGYLVFGATICGSVTLNLPFGTPFYDIVRIFYSFVLFITYSLQFYVAFQIIWSFVEDRLKPQKIYCELLTRTAFVTLTCLLAIAIPYIGDFNSLVGATGCVVLQFIFPPVIELFTFHSKAGTTEYPELLASDDNEEIALNGSVGELNLGPASETSLNPRGLSIWQCVKNSLILILGIVGMVTGTFLSMKKIVHDLERYSSSSTCSGGLGVHVAMELYENVTTATP